MTVLALWSIAAFGKKPPPAPAPAPAPVPAPAPAPEPEPEPTPEPPAAQDPHAKPSNVSFTATVTYADGSVDKGHVTRVERTEDWYGDNGWTDAAAKLTVTLEGNGTEKDVPWTELSRIDLTYGASTDVDCSYDSAFDPAMYLCVLKTTSKAKTKDGKTWDVADRHQWMFVFENGPAPEFFVAKLPARAQGAAESDGGLGGTEQEAGMYEQLQKQLDAARVGKVPKSIVITAP